MHGNRIRKNLRHPVPEGLDEILHADPIHGQVTFRTKVLDVFRPVTFVHAFDDTLRAQQGLTFRAMPMSFSSRMTITIFFHEINIGKNIRNFKD